MSDPTLYRYLMLKYALRLEAAGMKHSGGAIRPRIAKELGLSPRESRAIFEAELQRRGEARRKELFGSRENPGAQCKARAQ